MTRIQIRFIPILLCAVALCQAQSPLPGSAPMAKPSDLSISCRIDASTRTAEVSITNHTNRELRLRIGGPRIDFEAEMTNKSGQRLPSHSNGAAPLNPRTGTITVLAASIAGGQLAPKEQYTEKVLLGYLIDIPKQGGTFQVRIGRGLLPLPNDPFQLDPKAIVWCKPTEVTFPPLK